MAIGIFLWMLLEFRFQPKEPLMGFHSPIVASQLASSSKEFVRIVGDTQDPQPHDSAESLVADYVFIAVYWSLLINMAVLLTRRNFLATFWLGMAAGICITATALFDIFENIHTSHMIPLTFANNNDNHLPLKIHYSSLAKCILIFVTTTLLSPLFLWRNDWIVWVSKLFILATGIGLSGLLYNPAIEWASSLMGVCIILIAGLFTCCSEEFLTKF
ncbi:MAG TPA: hypothetical protein ACFYEK_17075 [Candidatus Wunengus sp. YC60]|uniref:hypothetical protein n=1 Tax=Candidatus Wunengus sp. YC60 TaxID=3367697 RepID=UPI00402517D7